MTLIHMRKYATDDDLVAIINLLDACDNNDCLDDSISFDDLRLDLTHPTFDIAEDLRLWVDESGHIIAFAELEAPDVFLWFKIHPQTRACGLENQILQWAEGRMGELARVRGLPARLSTWVRDSDVERIAFLIHQGFVPTRYFLTLVHLLAKPRSDVQLPDGFIFQRLDHEYNLQHWVELYNESFVDHWNYKPWTVQTLTHWLGDPQYRPDLNFVVLAQDGTLAGFCWCDIEEETSHRESPRVGWISLLGTRRGFRGRGLGRALLLEGMRRLKIEGVESVKLNVDAENPTGATKLYESAGFHHISSWVLFSHNF